MAKRIKQHDEYYSIPAYQRLKRIADHEIALALGMCVRSYKEKIRGYSDFSANDGIKLSEILGMPQDVLFATNNVSKRERAGGK